MTYIFRTFGQTSLLKQEIDFYRHYDKFSIDGKWTQYFWRTNYFWTKRNIEFMSFISTNIGIHLVTALKNHQNASKNPKRIDLNEPGWCHWVLTFWLCFSWVINFFDAKNCAGRCHFNKEIGWTKGRGRGKRSRWNVLQMYFDLLLANVKIFNMLILITIHVRLRAFYFVSLPFVLTAVPSEWLAHIQRPE